MAGYTQSELQAIYAAAGVGDDYAQRRLAAIIQKAYIDMGVIRVVATTGGAGAPLYNYNTRKYMASMAKPLIDLATACYGQGYTAAEITALAQTDTYGFSYIFALYAPDIVQGIFACMEQGGEILVNGSDMSVGASWTLANGFTVDGVHAAYSHNGGANTITELHAAMNHTLLTNSAWYVFDWEVITAATNVAQITTVQLSSIAQSATEIMAKGGTANYAAATMGTVQKWSTFFKAATDTSLVNFVITCTSGGACTFEIGNFSVKEIPNSAYSTNPQSTYTATQALSSGSSGSNYCKGYIAGVVTRTLQKMAEGEYGVYGTINKTAEPVLDYFTT